LPSKASIDHTRVFPILVHFSGMLFEIDRGLANRVEGSLRGSRLSIGNPSLTASKSLPYA